MEAQQRAQAFAFQKRDRDNSLESFSGTQLGTNGDGKFDGGAWGGKAGGDSVMDDEERACSFVHSCVHVCEKLCVFVLCACMCGCMCSCIYARPLVIRTGTLQSVLSPAPR